jgi:hypothetical protein
MACCSQDEWLRRIGTKGGRGKIIRRTATTTASMADERNWPEDFSGTTVAEEEEDFWHNEEEQKAPRGNGNRQKQQQKDNGNDNANANGRRIGPPDKTIEVEKFGTFAYIYNKQHPFHINLKNDIDRKKCHCDKQ